MRLLNKITLNLLSISLFIFLFGMVAFYYVLREQVDQNINLELEKRKKSIDKELDTAHSTANPTVNLSEKVFITPLDKPRPSVSFSDTLLFNPDDNKYSIYRQLGFVKNIGDQSYFIQIFKPLEETDRLIVRIVMMMNLLIIIIIITLLIANRHSSRQDWKVFYDTIDKINKYDVNSFDDFSLKHSDIKEFSDLNRGLLTMTERIKNDYLNLKEYIENASHEIQTPLAIINSKMELLLQWGDMQEKQYKIVADAYEASNRLSRLNKTLILLAKIENRQFPESNPVNPAIMINHQLESLEDLILSKKINIIKRFDNDVTIQMNPYLAEILLINLIKNAVRHNIKGGELIIELTKHRFEISNSGPPLQIDPVMLFERFHKSSSSPESLGLGLAIVQKICTLYGFKIGYNYKNEMHVMHVEFSKE
ncbi:MAG TPA: HAMP domain-containing sensor histidine kinase [Prolixibacteraceae bacterium]|nr:HAMP domain-containing sensor histidine kinase [Prolixibacteraceae bacterium]